MKPSVPGVLLVVSYLFIVSISVLVIALFVFCVSPWFILFHFIGIQLFIVVCYNSQCLCGVSCCFSFFISNFTDLSPLYIFLNESGRGLLILFIFPKNQLLVLLIFEIVFFIWISIVLSLIFMNSSTDFGFCFFFFF